MEIRKVFFANINIRNFCILILQIRIKRTSKATSFQTIFKQIINTILNNKIHYLHLKNSNQRTNETTESHHHREQRLNKEPHTEFVQIRFFRHTDASSTVEHASYASGVHFHRL